MLEELCEKKQLMLTSAVEYFTVFYALGQGPEAALDGVVGGSVGHAEPFICQQASQDAAVRSEAAEEAQMPSNAAEEQDVPEFHGKSDGAATDEAIHMHQDGRSAQKIEPVTRENTERGSNQQNCTLQGAPPGATSSQAAAEGIVVCQLQGQCALPNGAKADSASAEGAHVLNSPHAPSKGNEKSDSQQQEPQQQQQQQWRRKRTLAQMAHHSPSPPRCPEAQSASAASKASQQSVAESPDVVDLSEDAPVSTGGTNGTLEAPASLVQHAVSDWQPTSGQPEVQCVVDAEKRPDATMPEAVHSSGATAVPMNAQTAAVEGHHEQHVLPNTVPESDEEDVDVDVVQIDGQAEESFWGSQRMDMTEAAVGTAPQTLLQTCVLGTVPQTACTAIPATAIEPVLLSAEAPVQPQIESAMPEANKFGAHLHGQPLGVRGPIPETDVQVQAPLPLLNEPVL